MGLMDKFADPEIIHSLGFGDKMAGAGITTLMGMGTTFAVLILLWGCIALMAKINTRLSSQKKPETASPSTLKENTVVEDKREIAVVMAAIMAYEGGTLNNLVIRKISRVSGNHTAWANAGRKDSMNSRKR